MNKQTLEVYPSIAACNLMRIEEEIRALEKCPIDTIHLDVMDGHFVPLLTIGVPILEQLKATTKLFCDVHIMVTNPDQVFQDYLDAGATTLTFPIESAQHAHKICTKIKESGKKAGVALNPATHWQSIEFLLPLLDQVTIMAVNPGFSRQKHLEIVHPKIRALDALRKKNGYNFKIQVDGGVSKDNVKILHALGTDIVVAGGAIFNGQDYNKSIQDLRNF